MTVEVIRPGMLTTVQDQGRAGHQRLGIVAGGAADRFSARVANRLVGNAGEAAVLEIAYAGPRLKFTEESLVAWCGGDFTATAEGQPLLKNRPVRIPAGGVVDFGGAKAGAMAWLAIAGGISVPVVMASRSTYLAAGIGGHEGRALRQGDRLPLGGASPWARAMLDLLHGFRKEVAWSVCPERFAGPRGGGVLRVLPGPERDWFTGNAGAGANAWRVSKDGNRMGIRLEGRPLELREPREMASAAVAHGVIQVPPSGQPIILGADRQTLGGYPRIAAVAEVDLGLLAQLRPGDPVRFHEIDLSTAHRLWREREQDFQRMCTGLTLPRL